MKKTDKNFSRKLNNRFAKKQNEMRRQPGIMGDGYGNLEVTGLTNFTYVTIGDKAMPVFNNRVAPQAGVKVWVGYAPEEPTLFQVLSTRSETPAGVETGFVGYAPAKRYEWMAVDGGQDPLVVHLRAISFLRIGVSKAGGMNVDLFRGKVFSGTAYLNIARQDVDVTAHIPTTANKAALVMISIDNAGAVMQTKGSEVDIDALVPSDRPAVPANTVWVSGCVRVYYGQTAVQDARTNTDFDDLRFTAFNGLYLPLSAMSVASATDLTDGGATTLHTHAYGGGAVDSVTGDGVDNTDPTNPVMTFPTVGDIGAEVAGAAATAETNAKSYADGLVVGLWDDRGAFDASVNAYPSSGGSGTAGAILKGDIWIISVAGNLPTSQVVDVGDAVRALIDTPGNTQANWSIIQNNIGYVAENSANKSIDVNTDQASNTKYPSVKSVFDWAVGLFVTLTGEQFVAGIKKFTSVIVAGNHAASLGGAGDIEMFAPDGENPAIIQHTWGGVIGFVGQTADGTEASPTAVPSGKIIYNVAPYAYDGTNQYVNAHLKAVAAEAWDGSKHGTKWELYATPTGGSTTEILIATFYSNKIDLPAGSTYDINGSPHGHGIPATTAANDMQVGDGAGAWIKKTLAEMVAILRTPLDLIYTLIGNNLSIVKTLINQTGQRVFFFDLTTYDVIANYVDGSGSITQAFGIATVNTGATASSSARQNTNSQETYMSGVLSGRVYFAPAAANAVLFWGIRRDLLTTQETHVDTTYHAGFYYHNNQWYAASGNNTAQQLTNLAIADGAHVFTIDGSGGTNKFYVDGTLVATHSTYVAATYGYIQLYANNKALTSNIQMYFYNLAYAGQ